MKDKEINNNNLNNRCSSYVLLTAAYNEEKYITRTIESVINQTILPKRWVIVSDGSADHTDEIVKKYAAQHNFICFLRREKNKERNYYQKVLSLKEGFKLLANIEYDYIGTLDADISFEKDYFQMVLIKILNNNKFGIVGGTVLDYYNNKPHKRLGSLSSVCGAVQFFRKECLQSIGGFFPVTIGIDDSILEIKAKKRGWIVQSFPDLFVYSYRIVGTADSSLLKAMFKEGIKDYFLGNTILFEFLKCCHRTQEMPYIIGAVSKFYGFLFYYFKKPKQILSDDEIAFVRNLQQKKLKQFILKNIFKYRKLSSKKREELGNYARNRIINELCWEKQEYKLQQVYKKLINELPWSRASGYLNHKVK